MKKFLLSILAIFLIVEEWLWDLLSAYSHFMIRLLKLEKVELWLTQTTPNTAIFVFLIPILLVTPLNLIAIWLLLNGLIIQGIFLEIFAKLLGTLLVARVFSLTKKQLLTFKLIFWIYINVCKWLNWAHAIIIDTYIYQYSKKIKLALKTKLQQFLANIFKKSNP